MLKHAKSSRHRYNYTIHVRSAGHAKHLDSEDLFQPCTLSNNGFELSSSANHLRLSSLETTRAELEDLGRFRPSVPPIRFHRAPNPPKFAPTCHEMPLKNQKQNMHKFRTPKSSFVSYEQEQTYPNSHPLMEDTPAKPTCGEGCKFGQVWSWLRIGGAMLQEPGGQFLYWSPIKILNRWSGALKFRRCTHGM